MVRRKYKKMLQMADWREICDNSSLLPVCLLTFCIVFKLHERQNKKSKYNIKTNHSIPRCNIIYMQVTLTWATLRKIIYTYMIRHWLDCLSNGIKWEYAWYLYLLTFLSIVQKYGLGKLTHKNHHNETLRTYRIV